VIWVTFVMSLRELRRNTMRSILTMLGVIIGVSAVIALVTLGQGATTKVRSDVSSMGENLLTVTPGANRRGGPGTGATSAPPFTMQDVAAIEREVKVISAIAPSSSKSALMVYGNKNHSTQIHGSTSAFFTVDDLVIMPIKTLQKRLAGNNDVGSIYVTATSESATTRAKSQVEALLRERRRTAGAEDNFRVMDSKELADTLSSVTGALTALLGAIAGVSLIVGGIGIMNIMLVSVTERTREIGIRLAIGARGQEVLLQFLVEAIVLSLLGGVIGVLLGLGGSWAGTRALNLPLVIQPQIVVIALGFSAFIGVIFGFLPARKAARLNPIDALRHE
jgi:putative ABC transport system permease protein